MATLVIKTVHKTYEVPLLLCADLLDCYTTPVISSLVKEALNHSRLKVEPEGGRIWSIWNGKLQIGKAMVLGNRYVKAKSSTHVG